MLVTDPESNYRTSYLHIHELLNLIEGDLSRREIVSVYLTIAPAWINRETKVVPVSYALLSVLMESYFCNPALYLVSYCLCRLCICLKQVIVASTVWTGLQLNLNRGFKTSHIAETNVNRLDS